jgi:hypothetical protein
VTLVNVFTVEPEHQQELLDVLIEATEQVMSKLPAARRGAGRGGDKNNQSRQRTDQLIQLEPASASETNEQTYSVLRLSVGDLLDRPLVDLGPQQCHLAGGGDPRAGDNQR